LYTVLVFCNSDYPTIRYTSIAVLRSISPHCYPRLKLRLYLINLAILWIWLIKVKNWPWLWFLARDTTGRRRWCDSPISYLSCRLLHVDCWVWQFGRLLVIDMHVRLRSPSFSPAQLSSRLLWLSSCLQSLPHPTVGLFLTYNSSTISFILVIALYILENNRWMQYYFIPQPKLV
jgi:hypothetical protein